MLRTSQESVQFVLVLDDLPVLRAQLSSYLRESKNSSTTVSIGQANVAGQQVVQNLMKEERREKDNDEQTRIMRETRAASPPPLPANEGRIALPADRHSTKPAVDKKHGSKNRRRKGTSSDECSPSRPTISRRHCAAKGREKDD